MLKLIHKAWLIVPVSAILLLLLFSGSVSAKTCKGMSKSACKGSGSCTWVSSYTTKKGAKVDAYCRNKGKKQADKKASTKKHTTGSDKQKANSSSTSSSSKKAHTKSSKSSNKEKKANKEKQSDKSTVKKTKDKKEKQSKNSKSSK